MRKPKDLSYLAAIDRIGRLQEVVPSWPLPSGTPLRPARAAPGRGGRGGRGRFRGRLRGREDGPGSRGGFAGWGAEAAGAVEAEVRGVERS